MESGRAADLQRTFEARHDAQGLWTEVWEGEWEANDCIYNAAVQLVAGTIALLDRQVMEWWWHPTGLRGHGLWDQAIYLIFFTDDKLQKYEQGFRRYMNYQQSINSLRMNFSGGGGGWVSYKIFKGVEGSEGAKGELGW